MTKERLEGMALSSLLELCRKEELDLVEGLDRREIIDELLEFYEEERRDRESLKSLIIQIEASKFSGLQDEDDDWPEEVTLPAQELPEHYDDTRVSLILRDPNWAFVYWEIKPAEDEIHSGDILFRHYALRVFEQKDPQNPSHNFFSIPLNQPYGSQYINLPSSGQYYRLELHAQYDRESTLLASSLLIHSPSEGLPYELSPGAQGQRQKEILELSGQGVWEIAQQQAPAIPGAGSGVLDIPQRIGGLDEELFLETEDPS